MFGKELNVQEYLSLGYVYLVILGVLSDAIFYGILKFPIIEYTTILDALISPVSILTRDYRITLPIIIMFVLLYFYTTKWSPKLHEKNREKKWYKKVTNIEKADKRYELLKESKNILWSMLFLFGFLFLALRLGMAIGTKGRIAKADLTLNYRITFKDNSNLDVRKIGQNSAYIFYLEDGKKIITATPISDNVKQMKRIIKND